jgi:histidinol-phosphatase (PHP family)
MHSAFSFDCTVPIATQGERAAEIGLAEICVTDHDDYEPREESRGYYRPDAFFASLDDARAALDGRVVIRAGVEIGEWHRFPEQAQALVAAHPYDFVIGSLHWIDGGMVLDESFYEQRSEADVYEPYFTDLLEMVRIGGFDVIGHLDVPKRLAFTAYGHYVSSHYEEYIRPVLRTAIERGIGIEINTGTARHPVADPSPNLDVLRWYREMGGEIITVGSDAHRPGHLAFEFDIARRMLDEAGFTAITGFDQRKPFFTDLT